jgi:hypothetical protein
MKKNIIDYIGIWNCTNLSEIEGYFINDYLINDEHLNINDLNSFNIGMYFDLNISYSNNFK